MSKTLASLTMGNVRNTSSTSVNVLLIVSFSTINMYEVANSTPDCLPDWTNIQRDVGLALIKWVYTDQLELPQEDEFMLSLMGCASSFHLTNLVKRLVIS